MHHRGANPVARFPVVNFLKRWFSRGTIENRKYISGFEDGQLILRDAMRSVIGTDDVYEIRRMLDQAWEDRTPPKIVQPPISLQEIAERAGVLPKKKRKKKTP